MKKIYLLLVLLLCGQLIRAQELSLSGEVLDEKEQALTGASVLLLQVNDSSFIKGTSSNLQGFFEISNLRPGRYILKISYLGYRDKYILQPVFKEAVQAGKIVMQPGSDSLKTVVVTGQVDPVQIKNDTTQYNASSFKTNPDASAEDLLSKMPGISSQDGKVQAQGEEVKQVLVDGKPFFGDDPNAVLKNLPAEVVDKIQVFDKKSDQSQFTGFDDGNSSKTINIVTKAAFRNGNFGKVYAGYGNDERWKAGASLNFFRDKRRITVLLNSNNINEQNFSADDLLGVMSGGNTGGNRPFGQRGQFGGRGGSRPGGGGGRGADGGNNADNFLVDQRNGINTTQSFGLNYSDKWKNLDFTGSYFFNNSRNNTNSELQRQYFSLSGSGLAYRELSLNSSTNGNHRMNLRFDWKIDSLNSLLFQPRMSIQQNDKNNQGSGYNAEGLSILNSSMQQNKSDLDGSNFSAPFLFRHSFRKKGRTLSINSTATYTRSQGESSLLSEIQYLADSLPDDTFDQLSPLDKKGWSFVNGFSYTEPIQENSQFILNYNNTYNFNESDKRTFNYLQTQGDYSNLDSNLSNTFKSRYFAQSIGPGYRYQKDKITFNIGLSYQEARLKNEQVFPSAYHLNKQFISLLPNAMLMYRISGGKNLRINYRSSNNAPSVEQLQDVINNSNPTQISSGNSGLKQDFQQNLNIRYSSVNTGKSTSFFALLAGTYTENYIASSTFIVSSDTLVNGISLPAGAQFSKPVNLGGNFNLRSFVNYSMPVKKLKSNLSINASFTYSRTPGMINNTINYAGSTGSSLGLVLSSNISEKTDFVISSGSGYNYIGNSLQKELNSSYFNQNSRFKIQVMPWKGLVLQTELNHQYYSGLAANLTQNFLLWNAALAYKFMKQKQAEFRLMVFDLLKQNNSVSRNTTETYYEDVQNNILQRYFMLSFTYQIKSFKKAKSKTE